MKTSALIASIIKEEPANRIGALKKIGTISAIQRIVLTFQRAGVEDIYIISNREDILKKEISRQCITFIPVEMKDEEPDMFSFVKSGLQYLQSKVDSLFIMPSNVPLFTVDTIKKLEESHEMITIPMNRGISGHPIRIDAKVIPEILSYEGRHGLGGAVKSLGYEIKRIEVKDSGVVVYETSNEEFQDALMNHSLNELHPEVRVRVGKEMPFLGPGTRQLLSLLNENGSLRMSCEYMGISYSKGRGMLEIMEKQLGYEVVIRKTGGETGGSTTLTEKGADLLKRYQEYEKKVREYAEDIFEEYFFEVP